MKVIFILQKLENLMIDVYNHVFFNRKRLLDIINVIFVILIHDFNSFKGAIEFEAMGRDLAIF